MARNTDGIKVVATNRRARHDYELMDRYEAGLVLTGTEIKSVRNRAVNLRGSFVHEINGELFLMEANIAHYEQGNRENHEPKRPRKLLLHQREIDKIVEGLRMKGLTVVPTKLYLRDGWAKVEIAMARGKKKFDKRRDIARRDAERRVERALREKYR